MARTNAEQETALLDQHEGSEETQPTDETPTMADLKGVRYTGIADVRLLSVDDLRGVGVQNPKGDLEFSHENGHFVPASEINAETRDWFATQPDFVVE